MPFKKLRSNLLLSPNEQKKLDDITSSRLESHARVIRAKMLLYYAQNKSINSIAKKIQVGRPTVERCIDKALTGGINIALADLPRKGRNPKLTSEDKTWVINLACIKPKELGYANETWTYSLLVKHIRENAPLQGFPMLTKATKSSVHNILCEAPIKPHKLTYYLERKDPDFETKMAQILVVYKQVSIMREQEANSEVERNWAVISYDEKPGIQAIDNIAQDLPPVPGKYSTIARDYEYNRYGTVSLLAGIDLHDGVVHGLVRDRHRSYEFIEFLKLINNAYPSHYKLRVILDNHSAHISKETMKWLKQYPNRFEFIFTPKHGSWLNLVEIFFSKMTRSFLRFIRVKSKQELKQRIERYLQEINSDPVVFHWTYKMDKMTI